MIFLRVNQLASLRNQSCQTNAVIALESSKIKEGQKTYEQENLMERKMPSVEKTFDKTFLRAISINETASKINISIHILMMGFGASLILDAIIITAFSGIGILSLILAGFGVVSLGAVLAISPQGKIAKNAARSLQYQILYSGYVNQLEVLRNSDVCDVDGAEKVSLRLEQLTSNTVDKIESLNGK